MESKEIYSLYLKAYDTILPKTRCYQELVQETVSALESKKLILDAGVGTGLVTMQLDSPERTIYGTDINEDMLQKAKEKVQTIAAEGRILLSQQDIKSLNFTDGFFDGIICLNVLYHSYDYITPLREFARLLESKGTLVVSGPNTRFNSIIFLEKLSTEFSQRSDYQQYRTDLELVMDSTRLLSRKSMKHFLDAERMVQVLTEIGFSQILTAHNRAYYGNSYFVAAQK